MNLNVNNKARLLIADDEHSIRDLLHDLLSEEYDCATVSSAEEALTSLGAESFALLLSDINMTGISGLEMIPKVREISPETIVVMISGERNIQSAVEAMRGGAFDYITKPFDLDHIEAAVSRALKYHSALADKRHYETHLEELVTARTAELQTVNTDLERQIIERQRAEEKIDRMAYYDALTDLPNQHLFKNRLAHDLDRARGTGRKSAVFFLSPDRFKNISDTLGRDAGEQLLRQIGGRLTARVADVNTVAYLGGDEFALLFTNIGGGAAEVARLTESVQEALRPSFDCEEHEMFITAAVGVSIFPDDGEDCQALLKNASAALFLAKETGGDCYRFFKAEMHERALKRLSLEADLRRALERGEFRVFYQPQVSAFSGEIVGMEALVRWQHPELGLVPPFDFIPLAEETGLIVPLGEWVLREACRQSAAWRNAGYKSLRVGVNLSLRQFQQTDLVETVIGIIAETGFDLKFLELELTESMIMRDAGKAIQMLEKLRENGIKISVDDFGSGYSSLSYLKNLPLDALKIDRSFVSEMTDDTRSKAIVAAIITLADSLGLKSIAEGVETEEQLNLLRRMNCDEIQGYLFGKPVPAEEFENLLNKSGSAVGKKLNNHAAESGIPILAP
jgi:diguanylate cyclase (GGDEF)-like protein